MGEGGREIKKVQKISDSTGWKNISLSGPPSTIKTFVTWTLIFILWKQIQEKLDENKWCWKPRDKSEKVLYKNKTWKTKFNNG